MPVLPDVWPHVWMVLNWPWPITRGAIVLSIEVLSKTLKQACVQYKASEGATQILCSLMAIMPVLPDVRPYV